VTKIARPNTNPSITGRERNCATNPSRKSPASKKSPPQKSTSAAPSAAYSAALAGDTLATVDARRTAAALVPATTRCRLVPKTA
jgi:hypothetical protein